MYDVLHSYAVILNYNHIPYRVWACGRMAAYRRCRVCMWLSNVVQEKHRSKLVNDFVN